MPAVAITAPVFLLFLYRIIGHPQLQAISGLFTLTLLTATLLYRSFILGQINLVYVVPS